ncbi:MAG: glycoside hydrolase family 97 protein [Rhodopirellula sp.]|nr:glycoside hydrolase family 97 protein [Rhodopirellula sp.]
MKCPLPLLILPVALACVETLRAETRHQLQSPNGELAVAFTLADMDGEAGSPVYRVDYRGRTIVENSRLGFDLADGSLRSGFVLADNQERRHDSTWQPVYGERSTVRDRYHEATYLLRQSAPPHRVVRLVMRAYDEGIAFCYEFPRQTSMQKIRIAAERTEFRFPADHTAWAVYSAQGKYEEVPLSEIRAGCERPLVLRAADDLYLAVGEARLVDYARMKLAPLRPGSTNLVSQLSSEVEAEPPYRTPWRFVMVGESPGELLENNFLVLNLNDPCAIEDTSWIKPGKVIREVTLTTAGGKACVDFAAASGLQYVEFDAGWYGHEYSDESDATTVSVDPKRSPGPLDLEEVIRYAESRDIGIIVYVNRRALERQLDEILPLYRKWGIKGVKYGFVNVGSQQWTTWLHHAVRKAAENRLMVDVHDEYRPTGYSRTYPNLMTQEGIAGDETSPTNRLTLTILFTRMLAGAADNTICYYDPRVDKNATHAYQLAKAVCLYSPWQFLFWYDRPSPSPPKTGGAGGSLRTIGDEPELEFFAKVPTVWDETRVIHGRIGQYAVIARRHGRQWYVGAMNAGEERALPLPLLFLEPGCRYTVDIYTDDPSVATRTQVRIQRRPVEAKTVLEVTMSPQGGQAIRIAPTEEE